MICCYTLLMYVLENSLAVKKGAAMFKNGQCEKVVKSKGVAKKWLWQYRLIANIFITSIQVDFCCLILHVASSGISTRFTWIFVIEVFWNKTVLKRMVMSIMKMGMPVYVCCMAIGACPPFGKNLAMLFYLMVL